MTVCFLLMGIGYVAAKTEPRLEKSLPGYTSAESQSFIKDASGQITKKPLESSDTYVPKSGGLPSLDFIKRFGKHCTSHTNMIGRKVSGLCDDINVCNPEQYKACYKNCIQNRKKEDEKTMYIFGKLAACQINPSDKESVNIFNQASLRIKQAKGKNISTKTFEMPADKYQPKRSEGVRSVVKTLNPFSTNCTTHKNALGRMTSGVCDNGKQCQTANYKKCYNECVMGRPVDEKTFYVLRNLVNCRANFADLELGKIAKDVNNKYFQYEMKYAPSMLKKNNPNG